mgnify:FL=1
MLMKNKNKKVKKMKEKIIFTNGNEFEGEWPSGQGKMTRPDGWTHEGFWKNGKRHGFGTTIVANGTVYSGKWYKNQLIINDCPEEKSNRPRLVDARRLCKVCQIIAVGNRKVCHSCSKNSKEDGVTDTIFQMWY